MTTTACVPVLRALREVYGGEKAQEILTQFQHEERAFALHSAANAIQALHPGETKNSVIFLRERAEKLHSDLTVPIES